MFSFCPEWTWISSSGASYVFCLCDSSCFNPVQLHLLLHCHSEHIVEHMPMNDQTPQDFFSFFWGVFETAGRTGSYLHLALSKGFFFQQTQRTLAPINDKTCCSCSERLFSQTDAEAISEDKE